MIDAPQKDLVFSFATTELLKDVLNTLLQRPLEQNGAIACLQRFRNDLVPYYGSVTNLLASKEYQNVCAQIRMISSRVEKLPLIVNAQKSNTAQEWKEADVLIVRFTGYVIETMTKQRFSRQQAGEQDWNAWIVRNAGVDAVKDYDLFITAFVAPFWITKNIRPH
jgi:hypothetical protein